MEAGRIIDAHVHIFPDEVIAARPLFCAHEPAFSLLYQDPRARMVNACELVEAMDEDGVSVSVVCGFPWRDAGRARMHNDCILQAARDHPGRLVPLAGVDPQDPRAPAEAERALAAGARGLGEIGVYGHDLSDPAVRPGLEMLAGLCAEAQVPLLLHTNEPVGHAYPGKSPMTIAGLYELVRDHPRTRFQLAHLGGGLFFYELLRREVPDVLANCVFDTAAAPYLYRPALYRVFADFSGEHRLLYGSDFPLLRLGRTRRDLDRAQLEPSQRTGILGANAVAFWNLDRIPAQQPPHEGQESSRS